MEQKTNIVLIGMPGVGKSTIGVILAKVLGYSFLDADLLIQEQEGKLLREIIEEKGTDGFIEVENRVNASIRADRAIIATGGSVVYGKEAMEHLKEIGRVVYLKVSYAILEKRLADIKGRGVVFFLFLSSSSPSSSLRIYSPWMMANIRIVQITELPP